MGAGGWVVASNDGGRRVGRICVAKRWHVVGVMRASVNIRPAYVVGEKVDS